MKIDPDKVEYIFILSSTIVVSNAPLSYTNSRSIFTAQQRFDQTVENIEILRAKIPNIAIILVDPSPVPPEFKTVLIVSVDIYIDCEDHPDVREDTVSGLNKGVAECKQLLVALNYIDCYPNAKNIFKLTGRYTLNSSFDIANFESDHIQFKLIPPDSVFYEPVPACYTFFYKIPILYVEDFRKALINTTAICSNTSVSIETVLPFQFNPKIVTYDACVGISGCIGPSSVYFEIIN